MKVQNKNEYKEVLKRLILNERKSLKKAGYTDEQINEIFDNKFIRSVGERAKGLFNGSRDKTQVKSKPVSSNFSRETFSIEDLVDLILSDPSVPSYIKDVAATLEYTDGTSTPISNDNNVELPEELPDSEDFVAPLGDNYGFERDMRNAIRSSNSPKAQVASSEPRERRGSSKEDLTRSKNRLKKIKPTGNKKASLKEAILSRLSDKDKKDLNIQKIIEAIELQMKKKS